MMMLFKQKKDIDEIQNNFQLLLALNEQGIVLPSFE
jgi:hypothetical protein